MPDDGAAAVREIVAAAEEVAPDYGMNVQCLASLPHHEYDRVRKAEASRLGVRVSTLDHAIERARGSAIEPGAAHRLIPGDPAPWPDAVDGAALLEELSATIARYVVAGEGVFDALALWVLHAHALDAAMVSPRLVIESPEKRCGKTTTLTLIGALVPRALHAASITPAALFRAIDAVCPTILIDEADTFLPGNDELRGIVNAGHFKPTATVVRVVERQGDFQPYAFSAWAPIAIACIGRLAPTIEDRAIIIAMRRRRRDESVERLRLDRLDQLKPLAARAARWARDNGAALVQSDPIVPAELHDRAADNWRPLLAIADLAGREWPQRARRAALVLSAGREAESVRAMLLADLRELFDREPSGVLFTDEILPALAQNDNRPWPEWRHAKPITAKQLANLLRPLGALSNTLRRADRTGKGYRRGDLADAFERYCDGKDDFAPVLPSQPADSATCDGKSPVTLAKLVTAALPSQPADSATCDGRTANGRSAAKSNRSPLFLSSPLVDLATGEIDHERAAIAEVDGHLSRAAAGLIARLDADRPPVGLTSTDIDRLILELEDGDGRVFDLQ